MCSMYLANSYCFYSYHNHSQDTSELYYYTVHAGDVREVVMTLKCNKQALVKFTQPSLFLQYNIVLQNKESIYYF